MTAQNPHITVRPYNRRLTADIARDLFGDYDLILDGTDDADTRYLVNETAVALGLLASLSLVACEGGKPFHYQPSSDIPDGPGLFSGKKGKFVVIGDDGKDEPRKTESKEPPTPTPGR